MKTKNRLLSWLLIFAMMFSTFLMPATEAQAVVIQSGNSTYDTDDAKAFYNALAGDDALFANGHIYFATRGGLATYSLMSSRASYRTTYYTIGYTITASAGGSSLQVNITTPGNYYNEINRQVFDGNMEYTIRAIKYDDIVALCRNQVGESNETFQQIFSSKYVKLRMDAIVAVNVNSVPQGGINSANNRGEIEEWGTIYKLVNPDDLTALKSYGFGNTFESYTNIEATVNNNTLTINYYADTKAVSPYYSNASNGILTTGPTSTAATTSSTGFSIAADGKINGLEQKHESVRQFQSITLRTTSNLGLSKKGYYLPSNSEWKDDNGNIFTAGYTYTSSQINWAVTAGAATTNLYANWKPITYTLKYDANGGIGSMNPETHTYDEEYFRIKEPAFTRKGYTFTGWKLVDSNGNAVTLTDAMIKSNTSSSLFSKALGELGVGAYVRNLTASNDATLTLKAQWKPNEYHFTLNAQPPSGKTIANYTTELFALFNNHFSLTSGGSEITKVTVPSITGYKFLGYFEGTNSTDARITGTGLINFANTLYDQDKTLLGRWEPVKVTLTLNADTTDTGVAATPATQSLTATYDADMPEAVFPSKPGYTFKGFYTGKNGTGTQYYNNVMVSQRISPFTANTTLYAYWVDENKPSAVIEMESSTWTNSGDNI